MSEEPRKRSRFDQEETRDPRRSRFDRRSRSPDNREPEPVSKSVESPSNGDKKSPAPNNPAAASAAAAAAARINAAIQAKKASLPAGATADLGPVRAVSLLPHIMFDKLTHHRPKALVPLPLVDRLL